MTDSLYALLWFALVFITGYALIGSEKPLEDEIDLCPDSHSVWINGQWADCTGSPTHDRGGWYRGIEEDMQND